MIGRVRKFWLPLAAGAIFFSGSVKQDTADLPREEVYPFIDYGANRIVFAQSGLNRFHEKLDQLLESGRGKLNVVQIGDSHIQAGYFSHTVRRHFQKFFGNGGRGFVFPYRLINSNNPTNYNALSYGNWKHCVSTSLRQNCNFGINGIQATTNDENAHLYINLNVDSTAHYDYNKAILFHEGTTYGLLPYLKGEKSYDLQILEPGVSAFFMEQPRSVFDMYLRQDHPSQQGFSLQGLVFKNDQPGIVYHSIGLNGAFAASVNRNNLLEKQLRYLSPDLVIISLGTNDGYTSSWKFCSSCFKDNYKKLIKKVRNVAPDADILMTAPGDFYLRRRYHNDNARIIRDVLLEMAEEQSMAFWDQYTLMGGGYSIRKWNSYNLASRDYVHFTQKGYQLLGDLFFTAFLEAYEKRFDK